MSTNGNGKTERFRVTVPEIDPVTMEPTGQRKEYGYVDLPRDIVQEQHYPPKPTDKMPMTARLHEPQKHSQLSAAQRAKLTDDMVAAIQEQRHQINTLTQAIREFRAGLWTLQARCDELEAVDKAHGAWHLKQTESRWRRLKWFWTGR